MLPAPSQLTSKQATIKGANDELRVVCARGKICHNTSYLQLVSDKELKKCQQRISKMLTEINFFKYERIIVFENELFAANKILKRTGTALTFWRFDPKHLMS